MRRRKEAAGGRNGEHRGGGGSKRQRGGEGRRIGEERRGGEEERREGGEEERREGGAHLDLSERVQELVVAVGEHVQLVPCVSLCLLLGLGQCRLVSRRQLDVYLHILHKQTLQSLHMLEGLKVGGKSPEV